MRINHNIAALNTYRQLSNNNVMGNKSLEKLSSGLRINRAGDDAAGLAISEKMRGQIRGLDMASKNAQDGISLIQTAEGALNETHSILQRMRELAVQSASDTNTQSDRAEIQKEVNQLAEELSRIGNTTEFNTQKLLQGKYEGIFHIGANEQQNLRLDIADMRGFALGTVGKAGLEETVNVVSGGSGFDLQAGTYYATENAAGNIVLVDAEGVQVASGNDSGTVFTASIGKENDTITFTEEVVEGTKVVIADGKATQTIKIDNGGLEAGQYTITSSDIKDANGNIVASASGTAYLNSDGNTVLTVSSAVQSLAGSDGIELTIGGIDVSSQKTADSAITTINDAIEKVSEERAKLGAYQNRLEHTINNLGTASENLSAAESRIRDVDMAKEMMEYTKMAILQQAATAMLAQANQQPQSVLQLLG